jgi:hypothetical protein
MSQYSSFPITLPTLQSLRAQQLDTQGVFDFLVSASLAYEPGCGQPEPSSTHTTLLFDSFSPLSQVEFIFVFDMLQRRIE